MQLCMHSAMGDSHSISRSEVLQVGKAGANALCLMATRAQTQCVQ